MANTMRWRYGETNPVVLPVASSTVIEIGDLVYFNTTTFAAGALTYGGSLAATQESFHDKFAGVAMQASRNGDTQDIRVATTGVFEFGCASATFEVGARIGVDDNAGATALVSQQVIGTAASNPELSIGYCAKRVNPAGTAVLVDVVSTLSHSGPQPVA
jgi:hypothetical protein